MKFAVKYLKNMIYPLNVPESIHLTDGQMVLVRTDKGEENTIDATAGTVLNIEFDKTFRVEIGNAIAVSIEYKGQTYNNFGRRNIVRILNYEAVDGKLELIR